MRVGGAHQKTNVRGRQPDIRHAQSRDLAQRVFIDRVRLSQTDEVGKSRCRFNTTRARKGTGSTTGAWDHPAANPGEE